MMASLEGEAGCRANPVYYYLLTNSQEHGERQYGVAIAYGEMWEAVPNLTSFRTRAQSLLETLIRGKVTPVSLRDIVDDWLLE